MPTTASQKTKTKDAPQKKTKTKALQKTDQKMMQSCYILRLNLVLVLMLPLQWRRRWSRGGVEQELRVGYGVDTCQHTAGWRCEGVVSGVRCG
jgi:hypothetical protein